jgi:acetyl/propionyl-CoA carboxylase alpha subunit
VIEEAPSAYLSEDLRKKMGESAIKAGQAIGYTNAGTVEFIVDEKDNYYFLEVNTRLQVEHPVTEMITGLDLVKLQIDIAEGKALPEYFSFRGHAIEARLYAEDPENNFLPDTGEILAWQAPPNIRVDSGVEKGYEVSTFYDPMLAKIITYGENRAEAIRQMQYCLQNLTVLGLKTNQYFLAKLMQNADFQAGNFDTHFLARQTDLTGFSQFTEKELAVLLSALFLKNWQNRQEKRRILPNLLSGWRNNFYEAQFETYQLTSHPEKPNYKIQYRDFGKGKFSLMIPSLNLENADIQLLTSDNQSISFEFNAQRFQLNLVQKESQFFIKIGAKTAQFNLLARLPKPVKALTKGAYTAPMPGEVVKILVQAEQMIEAGQALLIINSMKMENTIYAYSSGQVKEIFVNEKALVKAGDRLLKIEEV